MTTASTSISFCRHKDAEFADAHSKNYRADEDISGSLHAGPAHSASLFPTVHAMPCHAMQAHRLQDRELANCNTHSLIGICVEWRMRERERDNNKQSSAAVSFCSSKLAGKILTDQTDRAEIFRFQYDDRRDGENLQRERGLA